MKITVLGCGALGQVWLAALARQGHEVQAWLRVPQPWCKVCVIHPDGSSTDKTFLANDPLFLHQCELLLVTLKAWQVATAVKNLQPLLAADCPILLLHNGMGTLEELKGVTQPLLRGITTHAAKHEEGKIRHIASGITHIGPVSAESCALHDIAATLHQALPDVAWHNNVTAACWQKLAANCVINPLTALTDCTNGELLARREQIALLCQELAAVMVREGQHTSASQLEDYVLAVITNTADNISSMLQDLRAGRRTEIDYITGYLLQRARAQGIATPEHRRLYDLIKRKEQDDESERVGAGLPGRWF